MTGTAVMWMSVTDAAVGEGDGDGPAGVSEDDAAGDDDGDDVGDSEADGVGARASGKHALAVTTSDARATRIALRRRIGLTLRRTSV